MGELPEIIGLKTEIRLLFQNLITNAIKFCADGVQPKITVKGQKVDEGWEFSVSDNGIGIEEKHQEKIFTIFNRLHSREEYKGTGIGLAHCKKIVDLHQGKIWVESEPAKGSAFHFFISKDTNVN